MELGNESIIPGIQSIYIKTWGCAHNSSDSEYMAGQLASYGYKIVGNFNKQIDRYFIAKYILKNSNFESINFNHHNFESIKNFTIYILTNKILNIFS